MRLFQSFCLTLILPYQLLAAPLKGCLESPKPVELILSVNTDGPASVKQVHERVSTGQPLQVAEKNTRADIQFVLKPMRPQDCILYDLREQTALDLELPENANFFKSLGRLIGLGSRAVRRDVVPMVYFKHQDGSRHFGLIDAENLTQLKTSPITESSASDLLAYTPDKRFTILYVLCPSDRTSICQLQIRHQGKWVRKAGKRLRFPILGRSRRGNAEAASCRTLFGGDTPQGIYYLWGTMFTEDPVFGNLPRLDLDSMMPPINALPFELHSPVLTGLVPEAALNDYWIHEWPLAFKLGRAYLRVHTNPSGTKSNQASISHKDEDFRTTQGCLNAGSAMKAILDTLVEIKVIRKEQIAHPDPIHSPTLGWRVIPKIGHVFLIVRDQ